MNQDYIVIDASNALISFGNTNCDPDFVRNHWAKDGGVVIFGVKADDSDLGRLWVGGVIVDRPASRAEIAAQIAEQRWQQETGGTVWLGRPVNTQRDAVAMLAGAIMQGETQGVWPQTWKFNDGQFYAMTPDDYRALGLAVRGHVSSAFEWEKQQLERLAAAPDSELSGFIINP